MLFTVSHWKMWRYERYTVVYHIIMLLPVFISATACSLYVVSTTAFATFIYQCFIMGMHLSTRRVPVFWLLLLLWLVYTHDGLLCDWYIPTTGFCCHWYIPTMGFCCDWYIPTTGFCCHWYIPTTGFCGHWYIPTTGINVFKLINVPNRGKHYFPLSVFPSVFFPSSI